MVNAAPIFTTTGPVRLYGLFAFIHVASDVIMPLTLVRGDGNVEGGEGVGVELTEGVDVELGVRVGVGVGVGIGVAVGVGAADGVREGSIAEFCAPPKCTVPTNINPLIMSATKNAFRSDFTIIKSIVRLDLCE